MSNGSLHLVDDEYLGAGRRQFRGKNRTSRAGSHYDEVILPFFIRYVGHFELPEFKL
jgi:hypothetical protein